MSALQTLYQTIDQLELDELAQVQRYIEHLRQEKVRAKLAVPDRIAHLRTAVAEFREGFLQTEWDEIAAAMNGK